ncbi:aminoglycoside 6-adenylyltransferase [Bacillus sp. SCS-153A]|uniref:aminoglycoside 6-adenylyltransferase n=1 Tax=Rossellomorea sedimentorum TaxID=3115294 RepID=UPI003905E73D
MEMFSVEERTAYLGETIRKLEASRLVEGVIQIGSGVNGFNDEFSDIDLMVATSEVENAEAAKEAVQQIFDSFNPAYIKEKKFSKDIFLLIVLLENKLEFNVSIVPRQLLTVRSPLWKVLVDKTGLVTLKMKKENDQFLNKPVRYNVGFDLPFEFVYCSLSMQKELKRKNLIYALRMLEEMREFTLIVQALNEGKKLYQFKAYETLNSSFKEAYLSTYPEKITVESVQDSAGKLTEIFVQALKQGSQFTLDEDLQKLLYTTKKR